MQAGLLVVVIFTLPETLFSRRDHTNLEERSYVQKLLFHGKVLDRKIKSRDFIGSLRMARYAAVFFPAAWYMTANTYGSALFAVTGAHLAAKVYGFQLEQIGLFMGVPLTIGNIIGEALSGWVSDVIINSYAKRHNGYRKPEARLYLIPLTTLLAVGTATYGYCIQSGKPWIDAAVVMAIAGVGMQVGTTMIYTYTTDSYKPQSGEIGAIINLFKSGEFQKCLLIYQMLKKHSLRFQHWILRPAVWDQCRIRCVVCDISRNQSRSPHTTGSPDIQGRENQGVARLASRPYRYLIPRTLFSARSVSASDSSIRFVFIVLSVASPTPDVYERGIQLEYQVHMWPFIR